ncbi:hypothetical protein HF078_06895 [Bacillus sp. RO2]|uniref:hypothetical protein n=1 Tax=Bacillus sp. RO2 TaxID=2723913 RepID=UPI00145F8EB7|nr:hypothetical protein [Bacillus sp. RO2]NMH72793.1 hypothetical protein [Bacillus sp. RO2]
MDEGTLFSKGKPSCLTVKDYKRYILLIEKYSNHDVFLIIDMIVKIFEAESMKEAKQKYKASLKQIKNLSFGSYTKQDFYGLSHIAYISKITVYRK